MSRHPAVGRSSVPDYPPPSRGGRLNGYKNIYVFTKFWGPPDPLRTSSPAQNRHPGAGNEVSRPSQTISGPTQNRRTTNKNAKTLPDVQHSHIRMISLLASLGQTTVDPCANRLYRNRFILASRCFGSVKRPSPYRPPLTKSYYCCP